jgi:hypothetical protein
MLMLIRPRLAMKPMLAAALLLTAPACATLRGNRTPPAEPQGPMMATATTAADIATQPVRDLGVAKPEIPPVLVAATADPYSRASTRNCAELAGAIADLDVHLGPDLDVAETKENRAAKLAEAGGRAVVNTIIPFRGLVRELTGAAAAQRRYADAIDAGFARRGFLRGLQAARRCRR